LHFYKPLDNEDVRGDARFRATLGPKGSGNDSLTMYFPTDQKSNFLQFEYNASLQGNYSFMISAISFLVDQFNLKVTLSFDKDRDGDYDKIFDFSIIGNTDRDITRYEGNLSIPPNLIDEFNGKTGGRIKMTIQREDDLDINILIYCGYRGEFSSIWLPYSKYIYEPDSKENGPDYTLFVILGLGAAALIVIVIVLGTRAKSEEPIEDISSKKRKGRK
jgi:hypothetical protein